MKRTISALLLAVALITITGGSVFAQNVLTAESAMTAPGASVSIKLFLSHDDPVQGFQTAVTVDNTILTLNDMTTAGLDVESLISPNTIEFYLTTIDNNILPGTGWGAVAAILDSGPPFDAHTIPPGTDQSIVQYHYDVANNPGLIGTSTTIALTNGLGPAPGINNVITVNSSSIQPTLVNGILDIIMLPSFKRGDTNNDNQVNIADGVFLVQYLFTGGQTPTCFSAGDTNDDGLLDITDLIYALTFIFLNGNPPPAPFPGCGVDPTGDSLGCLAYPHC